jgi:flagellar protein FliT
MLDSQEVLDLYETVATISDQMLAAARVGDWDRLTELESRCASQVDILRQEEMPAALPAPARERKVALIRKMLEDDRQIRSLTEPWMERLATMIDNTGTQRTLSQTYGARQSA